MQGRRRCRQLHQPAAPAGREHARHVRQPWLIMSSASCTPNARVTQVACQHLGKEGWARRAAKQRQQTTQRNPHTLTCSERRQTSRRLQTRCRSWTAGGVHGEAGELSRAHLPRAGMDSCRCHTRALRFAARLRPAACQAEPYQGMGGTGHTHPRRAFTAVSIQLFAFQGDHSQPTHSICGEATHPEELGDAGQGHGVAVKVGAHGLRAKKARSKNKRPWPARMRVKGPPVW